MKRTVLAVLLTVSATVVQSQSMGFKDLVLGSPLATEGLSSKLDCYEGRCSYLPLGAETIADYGLDGVGVDLMGERVSSITLSFHVRAFEAVRDAFGAKYSKMKCAASVVQNAMGAKFDQVICAYSDAQGNQLTLMKRSAKVDSSGLVMTTAAYRALNAQANEKTKAKGRKDL